MILYNEFDPFAADWLRELVAAGLIAPGAVDARDIRDIVPNELAGHRQVHLFAGIGVWSLALRLAGVPDDLEVWTASCPCQPFSSAGKGDGLADERHLWPAAFHLIRHCRPRIVMGEQVASPDGLAWLDVVLTDLEAEGYATRAVDLCAAGVGAPHIRQRLYWVGHSAGERPDRGQAHGRGQPAEMSRPRLQPFERLADTELQRAGSGEPRVEGQPRLGRDRPPIDGDAGGMGDGNRRGLAQLEELEELDGESFRRIEAVQPGDDALRCGEPERLGHALGPRLEGHAWHGDGGDEPGRVGSLEGRPVARAGDACRPGPTNGLWRAADWLLCRDAKWRPVEPGTFPLAHAGAFRNRVAELRGAGNAINVAQAAAFIRSNFDEVGATK